MARKHRNIPTAMRYSSPEGDGPMEKRVTGLYWVVTAAMAVFMLAGSVADVLAVPEAAAFMRHLGYPPYLLRFLGVAKILGLAVVCLPTPRTLKEWAYAGLTIDLTGALYSHVSVGDPVNAWGFPVIGLLLVAGSYLMRQRAMLLPSRQIAGPLLGDVRLRFE
jgi:hypothetical protein